MAGLGVVFRPKQVELGLRDVHLRETDVQRRPQRALGQRTDLAQRHAAKVDVGWATLSTDSDASA